MLTVMVVDEDVMFADALRVPLEADALQVVGIAESLEDAVRIAAREAPDIALVGLERLDGVSASDLGRGIRAASPSTAIVAVAGLDDGHPLDELLGEGFSAVLSKDVPLFAFVEAVRKVALGEPFEGGMVLRGRARRRAHELGIPVVDLTRREREVLELLVDGASGPDIAEELAISINTVRSHIQSLFSKLHVHSQLEAAAHAVRSGLVDFGELRSASSVPVGASLDRRSA
jgi:DNA-binding NarL/FixJ family response regulator